VDADLEQHDASLALAGCTADTGAAPPWDHAVVPPGARSCTLTVSWNGAELAYPALLDPSWNSTASLATARSAHVAGLLPDGTVLVAGGYSGYYPYVTRLASAERFRLGPDGTGAWAAAASMKGGPRSHALSITRANRFYVLNGYALDWCHHPRTSEFFDSTTNGWTETAAPDVDPPHVRFNGGSASLLSDGRILIAGGDSCDDYIARSWVDVYDPSSDRWTNGPDLPAPRAGHAAVTLGDGRVLVAGGTETVVNSDDEELPEATFFFDSRQNRWLDGPSLSGGCAYHGMVSLGTSSPDVLIFGGEDDDGPLSGVSRWTGGASFRTLWPDLSSARAWFSGSSGIALSNGSVLAVFGGPSDAVVFNPATEQWSSTGPISTLGRYEFTATDLGAAGKVLVVGGTDNLPRAEVDLYTYAAPTNVPPISQFCGDGIRDPEREECDLGEAVPERDLCSADCQVKDLLAIADGVSASAPVARELGEGRHPVAASADGAFAFVFVEPDSSPLRLGLSTYGVNGVPSDTVISISTDAAPVLMSNPVVASIPHNRYVVAYTDFDGDGDELGVVLRSIDPQSSSVLQSIHANTTTKFSQYDADLIATSTGLVAAWLDDSDLAKGPDIKFRTFDFDLAPTSPEQVLADSPANEGDVALASFGSGWAAAWRAGQDGAETLYVRTGSNTWTIGPYPPGPVGDRPALAEFDSTHLLVAFAEGTDPGGSGISNGSKIRVALLDTDHPGPAQALDLPVTVSSPTGSPPRAQSQTNAIRVGDRIYLGWRTEQASGDLLGEELWIKRIPTTLTPGGLDLTSIEIPLPRVDADRTGDQRRPAFAAGHATFYGEIVTAYEDRGRTFGSTGHGVIAIEALPSPIVRPCNDASDCESLNCYYGVCEPADCADGIKNGSESDVDCGGTCGKCRETQACGLGFDCESGACFNGACVVCMPNATGGCSGNVPLVCDATGQWQNRAEGACPASAPACLNGNCVACAPNPTATQCMANTPLNCTNDGRWAFAQGPCSGMTSLCQAGVCVPGPSTLAMGASHTCVRFEDGKVKCWGTSGVGELGLGDTVQRGDGPGEMGSNLPFVNLGTGRTAAAITAGVHHTCALLDNGQVKCWGWSVDGELGLGDTSARGDGPGEMGDSLPAVSLGTGRTAVAISAGSWHTCARLDNGQSKCWGANADGQLGLGDTANRGDNPGEMGDSLPAVALGTGRTATAIWAGGRHTCALLDNGQLKCWGSNQFGQCGVGDTITRGDGPGEMGDSLPSVSLGTGRTASSLWTGYRHNCARLDNGQTKCWGNNDSGQLGLGDTNTRGDGPGEMGDSLPAVLLGTGRTALSISASSDNGYTCARLDNAQVKCWGNNSNGRLGLGDMAARGDGPGEMGDNLPAVDVGTNWNVKVVATASGGHACAILFYGGVKCWGSNALGQLGLGDTAARGDGPGEMGNSLPTVSLW
jgi:alpha-tubulin suppressor-like RCC1 family protein